MPAIIAAYGNPLLYVNAKEEWETNALLQVPLRYSLRYAFGDAAVTHVRAHKRIVYELADLLARVVELGARLPYGGCYCWRPITGSLKLSTHVWGIAVDLDPHNNPRGCPYDPEHGMPMPVVDLFETAGWTWGGRWTGMPDPMHFQAASGY